MKLAEAFQIAGTKEPAALGSRSQADNTQANTKQPNMPHSKPSTTRTGETHITWSDAEWLAITRELIRLFPELGLPSPSAVALVRIKQMEAAMRVLPVERRRQLVHLTTVRPRLASYCKNITDEVNRKRVQPIAGAGPLPPSVVYRQPDGAQAGQPESGTRIYWRESEWYALAVELVFMDSSFLDTLNHLQPADVFRAQRVLPTNRRRPQTSIQAAKIRAELAPAVRRVRAAIDAKRNEEADTRAAEANAEAQRAEQARQAAEMTRQDAMREELAQSPAFVAKALGAAAFGPLLDALLSRGAASLQTMLENALVNAFSSDAVKRAMVVNLHMDRAERSAQEYKAHPPSVGGSVAASVVCKPKIGILGALPQQGETIAASYPQLRIKAIDKNLSGQSLREAVSGCDRVIAMTSFISHSMAATVQKTLGERYTRIDGGVSSVRRQIDIWLSTGALQAAIVAASDPTPEAKAE